MEANENREAYEMAFKKMKKIKGFYIHLIVYLIGNIFIIIGNSDGMKGGESYFQFHNFTTVFFWGIGLVAHGCTVFIPHFVFGKD